MIKKQTSYEFKYGGDFHSIDTVTVLQTQMNFITTLNEIKSRVYPEINLDFKIRGTEKGSLELHHVIEVVAGVGMFVMENYGYVNKVFNIFNDIIKLRRFLKNKKADSIKDLKNNKVELHLHGNNITIEKDAIQIYQDSSIVNNSLMNTGRLLASNEEVKSIEVTEGKRTKKLLKIGRKDFGFISESNPYLDKSISEELYRSQILFIKKANLFPGNNKNWFWEFIHKGRDIKAKIIEEKFKSKINHGLKVGQGDRIRADLKTFLKFDKRFNAFIETGKYEVINITEIIGRNSQTKLDF
jgi:hypothetical protein